MDLKLIFLTGICFLVGFCQGAETPSDTTSTTNSTTEPTPPSNISLTTTPAPGLTVSTPPQSQTWVVVDKTTNETCKLAHIISEFKFTYPVEIKADANIATGNTIIIVPLHNITEATGLCTNTERSILLKWKEDSVEIDFQLGENKNPFVSLNTLNVSDQQNFSGKETVLTFKSDATLFKTQVDMSYKSDKVQHVNVTVFSRSSSAILSISHTKFQAIRKKDHVSGPGLILRPMPLDTDVESNLIRVKASVEQNVQHWTNQLDEFLEEYKKPSKNAEKCDYYRPPQPGKFCDVDVQNFYPCITQNMYNYNRGGPCIFLKLNKIYGWKPIMYNESTKLPDKMPQDLTTHIDFLKTAFPEGTNRVWVSCEGENPADVENIGPINYIPGPGFPWYFFPYLNQEGYLSPIVAVFFQRPATGVRINIVCKAWAENLSNDRSDSTGSIHFVLMVDK